MLFGSKKIGWLIACGLILLVMPVLGATVEKNQLRLLPVDESDRDPTLIDYLERLQLAIKHREPERLVELVSNQVYNGIGKEEGVRKFAEYWKVDAIDSEIWDVLQPILDLGGGFVRSEKGVQYCAPYVFTEFPVNLDIFDYGAVIVDTTQLMSEPSSSSNLVATLSYHLVKIHDWRSVPDMNQTPDLFWIKVSTLDGQEGFVRRQDIRSPSEYSACFLQNRDGSWKMTSLFSQVD
jgi:hypothetical protein